MLNILNKLIEKYSLDIRGVIHIGAHYGQEYPAYITNDIENIIMIEPQPDAFEILQKQFKDDLNITLLNLALGAENKIVSMNVDSSNKGGSASVLKPKLHLQHYPDIIFNKTIETRQKKLDDLTFYRKNYNFIVIDVQGYELEVLKGATQSLENIDYIISEVNKEELYEHGCLIDELDEFLEGLNFSRVETDWCGDTWGNALYIKKTLLNKSENNYSCFQEFINNESVETIIKPDLDYYYKDALPVNVEINEPDYFVSIKPIKENPLPKISIIIASFNENNHLEECLQSIKKQNYQNLECIFVDAGNSENSTKILEKYSFVIHKPVNYQDGYSAINEAFKTSTGEIMTWINSDDKYSFNAFEIISSIFSNFQYIDWLTTRSAGFTSSEEVIEDLPLWSGKKYLSRVNNYRYIHKEGTFWRRTLWEKAGATLNLSLATAQDFELWARFFRYTQLYTLNKIITFRRYKQYKNMGPFRILTAQYLKEAEKILTLEKQLFLAVNKPHLPATELIQIGSKGILSFKAYIGNNSDTLKKIALILWENDCHIPAANYLSKATNYPLERFFNKPNELQNSGKYLISAIILLDNTENLLEGCIENLCSQTISDKLEIIFIDGNTEKKEQEIINKFQQKYPNIIYLKKRDDETNSLAFNRAVKMASGSYITKIKAGDRFKEDAFELILRDFTANPMVDIIFSRVYINKSENAPFRLLPSVQVSEIPNDYKSFLINPDIIKFSQPVWKSSLHKQFGYYDLNDIDQAEKEFIIRLIQIANFKITEQVLGYYLYSVKYKEQSLNYYELKEDNKLLKIYLEAYDKGEIINLKNKLSTMDLYGL
jgi:FkbM family methyltransferase